MKIPGHELDEHVSEDALTWWFENKDAHKIHSLEREKSGRKVIWRAQVLDGPGVKGVKSTRVALEEGFVVDAACSCAESGRPMCRHAAFLALQLFNEDAQLTSKDTPAAERQARRAKPSAKARKKPWSLPRAVEEMEVETLRELVGDLISADPKVAAAMYLRVGGSDPKESAKRYQKFMTPVLNANFGRTRAVKKTQAKNCMRSFEGLTGEVERHFEAGRLKSGSLILQGIFLEFARLAHKFNEHPEIGHDIFQKIYDLTAVPWGMPADDADKREAANGWIHVACNDRVIQASLDIHAGIAAMAAGGKASVNLVTGMLAKAGDGGRLLNLFGHYERDQPEKVFQILDQIKDDPLINALLFPHFFFRKDWKMAQLTAMHMVTCASRNGTRDVTLLVKGSELLLKSAEFSENAELRHHALATLCFFNTPDQTQHIQEYFKNATRDDLEGLMQGLKEFSPALTDEAILTFIECLSQSGAEHDLVEFIFQGLQHRHFTVDILFPVAELLRKPMANMWTDFIQQEAIAIAEGHYLFQHDEKRFVSIMRQLKHDAPAAVYRKAQADILEAGRRNFAVRRFVGRIELEG